MTMDASDIGLNFEDVFKWVHQHREFTFDLEETQGLAVSLAQTDFINNFFGFSPATSLDFKISRTILSLQTQNGVIDELLSIQNMNSAKAEAYQILIEAAKFSNHDPASLIFKRQDPFVTSGFLDFLLENVQEKYPNWSHSEAKAYLRQFILDGLKDTSSGSHTIEIFLEKSVQENLFEECFAAGTSITLADGSTKPIEDIVPNDMILSYDAHGNLTPGRVKRTFEKHVIHILDVFGMRVTPGHVTLCGGGVFDGRHVPIIDILRSDGALVQEDGSKIRACTGADLGAPEDQMLQIIAGDLLPDGRVQVTEARKIRVGTRVILPNGRDISVADLIRVNGATVTEDGLVQVGDGPAQPFHWTLTDNLPQPEDYILQRSNLTLRDIYGAKEWEEMQLILPTPYASDRPAGAKLH